MNMARARRRWREWDRYVRRIERLSPGVGVPLGAYRAIGERRRCYARKFELAAKADAVSVVSRVLSALDNSRAAA